MQRIGFLSFGWYSPVPESAVRTAGDMIRDTIRLAEAAEDAGLDGAYMRVHHWENNTSSPFPLLTAMGMRTERIELGTAVINMRYENPLYMAEAAATTDLAIGGRLWLGVSRGSPELALDGPGEFGYPLPAGVSPSDDAHARIARYRAAIAGEGVAAPNSRAGVPAGRKLTLQPQSPGLSDRLWYGAGSIPSAVTAAQLGMHLMSSTLVLEATGEPLPVVQNRQIEAYRTAWRGAGHDRAPRVLVTRSVMPIVDEVSQRNFGGMLARESMGGNRDQIGEIDNTTSTFGRSYVGDLDKIERELREDEAVMNADTVLVTIANQFGAEVNHRTFIALAELRDRLRA